MGLDPRYITNVAALSSASGGGYTPEAEAYFAAMAVPPDAARKTIINNLIVAGLANGWYAKLSILYLLAAADSQAACLNVINPTGTIAIPTNSPTFTADRGFAGNGTTSYVDTGFAGNGIPNMTQNNAFVSAGTNAAGSTGNGVLWGQTGTTRLFMYRNFGGITSWSVHNGGFGPAHALTGRYSALRNNGASIETYFNGATDTTIVSASASQRSSNVAVLRNGGDFSDGRTNYFASGSALTHGETVSFDADILAYLTAIGAN